MVLFLLRLVEFAHFASGNIAGKWQFHAGLGKILILALDSSSGIARYNCDVLIYGRTASACIFLCTGGCLMPTCDEVLGSQKKFTRLYFDQ
jgi:hypothetical protein